MKYLIENRLPSLAEYETLCRAVGWGDIMNFAAAETALPRSITGVVAFSADKELIGMGRLVGDGSIYYYIQDIVVTPAYQKQGVGTTILTHLCDYIRREAPAKSFVGLFSVPDAVGFYRKFTFEQRDLVGLFTVREMLTDQLLGAQALGPTATPAQPGQGASQG